MVMRAILTLALLLPIAAHAEDMFRWRDARGRIHYSNDTEKVPAGSAVVTKQLGHIGGEPIGEAIESIPTVESRGGSSTQVGWPTQGPSCIADEGFFALPHRSVDFDRPYWYALDRVCGPQNDIEGWLRRAATALELRKIGL